MGGSHFKYKVTFARNPFEQRAAEELRRLQGSLRQQHRLRGDQQVKGGRQSWRPAPVQGLAMAEGQDLSDIQGGLAKASGPRMIVLQVDKELSN